MAAALALHAVGCIGSSGGGLRATGAAPLDRLTRDSRARSESEVYSHTRRQLDLFAAANETAQFQIELESAPFGGTATLECSALTAAADRAIPADRFSAWLEQSLIVSPLPAWLIRRGATGTQIDTPDVLIPLDSPRLGGRVPLSGGQPSVVWCELAVPADAKPGDYHGAVTIKSGSATSQIGLRLHVWPFALPDPPALPIVAAVDAQRVLAAHMPRSEDAPAVLRGAGSANAQAAARALLVDACLLLRRHGLNPYLTNLYPHMTLGPDAAPVIHWESYDDIVAPLLSANADLPDQPAETWWAYPVDRQFPSPAPLGGIASAEYAAVLRQFIAACKSHFAERGYKCRAFTDFNGRWTDPAFGVTETVPRQPAATDYTELVKWSGIVDAGDPDAAFWVAMYPTQMAPFGWTGQIWQDLSMSADMFAPPSRFLDPRRIADASVTDPAAFFTPDDPSFGASVAAEAGAADTLALAALAFIHRLGVWLPTTCAWPESTSLPLRVAPHSSRNWLLYPGSIAKSDRPLPSMRLKRLHRASQDHAYLQILKQRGREATARLIAGTLARAMGSDAFVDNYQDGSPNAHLLDPDQWEQARRLMGAEIEATYGTISDANATRALWSSWLARTQNVEARQQSAICARRRDGDKSRLEAAITLTLSNHRPQPLTGTITLDSLPIGWTPVSPTTTIGPIASGAYQDIQIVLTMPEWPATPDGHVNIRASLNVAREQPAPIILTISALASSPVDKAPAIDGRLTDWALSGANVAAAFRSVGPPQTSRVDTSAAYVRHDATTLYVAVRCARRPNAPHQAAGNRVTYDGLMPVGEDLVEVLIDPGRVGADASDLYYLVFKSGGSMIASRGIPTEPPIGVRRPWTDADIAYAVRGEGSAWIVEAAIPLSAFGDESRRPGVWGFNVASFNSAEGTYSNWSCAERHVYHPQTLGNLLWTP